MSEESIVQFMTEARDSSLRVSVWTESVVHLVSSSVGIVGTYPTAMKLFAYHF